MAIGEQLKGGSNEVPKWGRAGAALTLSAVAILSGCSSSSETPDAPTTAGQTAEQIGDNTGATQEALAEQPKRLLTEPGEKAPYTKKELIDQIRDYREDGFPILDDEEWISALREEDLTKRVEILAEAGVSQRSVGLNYYLLGGFCISGERVLHDNRFNDGEPIICAPDVLKALDEDGTLAALPIRGVAKLNKISSENNVPLLAWNIFNPDDVNPEASISVVIKKEINTVVPKIRDANSAETIGNYESLKKSLEEGAAEAVEWWNSH